MGSIDLWDSYFDPVDQPDLSTTLTSSTEQVLYPRLPHLIEYLMSLAKVAPLSEEPHQSSSLLPHCTIVSSNSKIHNNCIS